MTRHDPSTPTAPVKPPKPTRSHEPASHFGGGKAGTASPPGSMIPEAVKNIPDQSTTDWQVANQPSNFYNAQKVNTAAAKTNTINAAAVAAETDAKNKKLAAAAVGAGALLLLLL